jgi:hypothetical protein
MSHFNIINSFAHNLFRTEVQYHVQYRPISNSHFVSVRTIRLLKYNNTGLLENDNDEATHSYLNMHKGVQFHI